MGGGGGGKKGGGGKSKKKLNKVQQRFKQRESMGLSGLTGLSKGTEKKGKNSTIGIYRQYQQDSVRGRAGNQEAAARAAKTRSEAAEAVKKAAAKKAEATRKNKFDPNRLKNVDRPDLANTLTTAFTNPAFQNFGQNFGKPWP